MDLADLIAYAEETYHISEQRKWASFPGFSVLVDPKTEKWVALLMRQWDSQTGTEIQCCDLKCGQDVVREFPVPYLTVPFRMKGPRWAGIVFGDETDPSLVRELFDRALRPGEQRGYTIVLESPCGGQSAQVPIASRPRQETLESLGEGVFRDTEIQVPEKIREMRKLCDLGDGSFEQKRRNFYRQGKFMEDYEDDREWAGGSCHQYFASYQDLNVRQLREYFTWRGHVRRGEYRAAPLSFAYLYLYELLCGIGTEGPEDSLIKMGEFESGFIDAGLGDVRMRQNLHRWMFEYAVLHDLPVETVRAHADPQAIETDKALAVLRHPQEHDDEELFFALCSFCGERLVSSAALSKDEEKGKRLFAGVWRHASRHYQKRGNKIFAACFGEPRSFAWHPLENAIHWEEKSHADSVFELDECRSFRCENGAWRETRYDSLFFDRGLLAGLVHEADRVIRRRLKTGHYLKARAEEAWATPYAEAAFAEEELRSAEAARPKVDIDFSELDQIRRDASVTRDSLLTEEEIAEGQAEDAVNETPALPSEPNAPGESVALRPEYREILELLLRGEPVEEKLRESRLMPNLVADYLNEQMFDIVGDNVLTCDGGAISLVEDYEKDVARIIGGARQ